MNGVLWKAEDIAQLRELATTGCGARRIAEQMGRTYHAVRFRGYRLKISFRPSEAVRQEGKDRALRERWRALIGPMRGQLRRELGA
jgi:hypothetical protein